MPEQMKVVEMTICLLRKNQLSWLEVNKCNLQKMVCPKMRSKIKVQSQFSKTGCKISPDISKCSCFFVCSDWCFEAIDNTEVTSRPLKFGSLVVKCSNGVTVLLTPCNPLTPVSQIPKTPSSHCCIALDTNVWPNNTMLYYHSTSLGVNHFTNNFS